MAIDAEKDGTPTPYPQYKGLLKAVEGLGFHDHLCLIYETAEEQFAAVVPFIRVGLERGEKCVYIADENASGEVIERMRKGGVDTKAALASGAFSVMTKKEAYLKQGFFDPDWMIRFLKEATDSAVAEGYTGLRATGEMTWMLGGDPGSDRLIEYEAKLNYFFPENNALAICQYNIGRFSPEIIMDVIRTHPLVIYRGQVCRNFYYTSPEEMLLPNQSYLEVSRLLYNILERERLENLNNESEESLGKLELEAEEIERVGQTGSFELDIEKGKATWSAGACRILGINLLEPPRGFLEHLGLYSPAGASALDEAVKAALEAGKPFDLELELAGSSRWVICRGGPRRTPDGRITGLRAVIVDITGRKLAESANVKFLSGLLPICAYCKKIRNDKGYWEGLEKFIRERSGAEFTHCICPECAEKFAKKDIGMA